MIKEYMEEVVDYIENNITDHLTAQVISDKIGYSKFYIHRLFQFYTGYTLMEYVRRRKLNHAIMDLKSDMRIIDIAFKYGYGSERAFSRAFINYFGNSPSTYRGNSFDLEDVVHVYNLKLPDEEWVYKMKEYLSEVRYEILEEMTVLSGISKGFEPEEEIIGQMNAFAKDHNIAFSRCFGFDSPVSEEEKKEGKRAYEFWLKLDKPFKDDSPYKVKTIASYKYACLRITDPFSDPMVKIPNGWKAMVAWLEENMKSMMTSDFCLDCLEEVIEIDGVTYMDIFVPIAKA